MDIRTSPLDNISVAKPCSADWNAMKGNERVRFCDHCSLNVYNLSAMPREAAAALVRATEGRMCVRFHRRADGTMLTQDCPVGMRAVQDRMARRVRSAVAAIAALVAGVAGNSALLARTQMGRIAMPRPEPARTIDTASLMDSLVQISIPVRESSYAMMGDIGPETIESAAIDESDTVAGDVVADDTEIGNTQIDDAYPIDDVSIEPDLTSADDETLTFVMGVMIVADSDAGENDALVTEPDEPPDEALVLPSLPHECIEPTRDVRPGLR